jgi:predicted RNase H-like HicB family nuclease
VLQRINFYLESFSPNEHSNVAKCLENSIVSQGKTVEEAINNLKEALDLYFEDSPHDMSESKQTFITTVEVTV